MKIVQITLVITWLSFLTGFTMIQLGPRVTAQKDTAKAKRHYVPVQIPQAFVDSINKAEREAADKFARYDSILDARDKKLAKLEGTVISVQQSNLVLKQAANRFILAFMRYKADPANYKLDIDWSDIDTLTTEKKSPEQPTVDPEAAKPVKRTFWQRLFKRSKK